MVTGLGLSFEVALLRVCLLILVNVACIKLLLNLSVSVLMVNPHYLGQRVALQLLPADELSFILTRSGGFVPQIYSCWTKIRSTFHWVTSGLPRLLLPSGSFRICSVGFESTNFGRLIGRS